MSDDTELTVEAKREQAKARFTFHELICPICMRGQGLCLRGRQLASATMPGRKEHRKRTPKALKSYQ